MDKKLRVKSSSQVELIDITSKVKQVVNNNVSGDGHAIIYVPHTTAAVTINENADPSVKKDIVKELNKIVPFKDNYAHMEGNSAAHIKASLIGNSEMIIIENGQVILGRWQGIFLSEFDGPRTRKVYIDIFTNS
jgi:secondary thiamine-phosphate synthase enzyme